MDRGRPCDGAGLPRSGHVWVKRSGSGLSCSSGAITDAWRCRQEPASSPLEGDSPCPRPQRRYCAAILQRPCRDAVPTPGMLPVSSVHRAGGGGPSSPSVGLLRVVHPPPGEPYADQSCRRDCIPASLSHGGHTVAGQSAGLQSLLARDYPPEFWAGLRRRPGALPRPL
jgi:hypothetical protein